MNPPDLLSEIERAFSDPRLFAPRFVNDRKYLQMQRLHARVCGLLSRVGHELGYVVDFGRRYPIDPIVGPKGRKQRQAESDLSFIDPAVNSEAPVVLLDYESSDAPISKMRDKFRYFSTFAKFSQSVEVVGLFMTVTGVKGFDKRELPEAREEFAKREILELISKLQQCSHNQRLFFLLGTFLPDYLQLRLFKKCSEVQNVRVEYSRSALALADDLVGCVDGPTDLATNPIYMQGFGE